MRKIIQYYSLLITLFLCASLPSYTNTETLRSRRQQKSKQRERSSSKKFASDEKVLVVVKGTILVVVSGIIFFAVKKNNSQDDNNPNSTDKNQNVNKNTQINQQSSTNSDNWNPTRNILYNNWQNSTVLTTLSSDAMKQLVSDHKSADDIIDKLPNHNVNHVDESENTILYYALDDKKYTLAEKFINRGANTLLKNGTGLTNLYYILNIESNNIIKNLIDAAIKHNENVVKVEDENGLRLLDYALVKADIEIVKYLIQTKKADTSYIQDASGMTPLHYAIQLGALEIVKLIIETAEQKNTKNKLLRIKTTTDNKTAQELAQEKLNGLNDEDEIKRYNEIIKLTTPTQT